MAKRRTRTRTPPPKARGVVSWLMVLVVAGLVGWLWWRAAYRPAEGVGWVATWQGWWRGSVEDQAIEELPFGGGEELLVPVTTVAPVERPVTPPAEVVARPPGTVPAELLIFPTNPAVRVVASDTGVTTRAQGPVPGAEVLEERAFKKAGSTVLAVQLALARRGISAGPIDGVAGSQTRAALRVFQRQAGLPATGWIDEKTMARLGVGQPVLTNYVVTAEDLSRLTWVPSTWLGKASRERLDYESILELVSEKTHANPKLVRQLNPRINWSQVRAGTSVVVPAAALPPLRGRAGFVKISLSEKALRVYDVDSTLVAHFPCSIARKAEKRPVGELKVVRLAPNPNYRFDPEIFKESAEARRIGRKLMIPPGPNNPVGTAWIGLSRPGYGIHGTPHPEDVGRTESHGCFRLANWNAEFLLRAAWVGMPVFVEP